MVIVDDLRGLNREQRAAFIASLLGWTLDAFDFFLLTFVVKEVAHDFHVEGSAVLLSLTFTLAARPFGALFFGWLADKFGRKPVLQIDVALYAFFALVSAFSPNLIFLLVMRTLFGFAMGGEWGIGASLVMESIPAKSRGVISGLLQEGYAFGQLIGALVFWFVYPHFAAWFPFMASWRVLFLLGVLPALLVLYMRRHVKESPAWEASRGQAKARTDVLAAIARHWKRAIYVVILMTAFNFFSHGTQDNYTTFLRVQHGFTPQMSGMLTAVMNIGAILGGAAFGAWSQTIGRRRAIVIAALLAIPIIPLWAFAGTPLLLGPWGFLDADFGAGRLGRRSRASERTLPAGGAGHLSRRRLSVRQPVRFGERGDAGSHRRNPQGRRRQGQLWPRPRRRGRGGGDPDRRPHLVRPGSERRRVRDQRG